MCGCVSIFCSCAPLLLSFRAMESVAPALANWLDACKRAVGQRGFSSGAAPHQVLSYPKLMCNVYLTCKHHQLHFHVPLLQMQARKVVLKDIHLFCHPPLWHCSCSHMQTVVIGALESRSIGRACRKVGVRYVVQSGVAQYINCILK